MKRITRILSALVFIALLCSVPHAQQPAATQPTREDRIALYQALLDLTNPWTVMCVAAHPDDEDGTSLIVMRRKYGAHTVSLFSTFGEGGQNAIGPELYEELGAIRARETLAASEIQGSEPYFLGLRDFGFSKSRDETFQKWGHEEALRRMVLQIRKLRPDVIITNHSTTSNDHGHHQATARLVVEAFDAAADPKRFPEQLETVYEPEGVLKPWQVQRLFVRQRGTQAPPADAQLVTIDPNERDPVRGTLFAEQALSALQKHATQGPWPKSFAEFTARFRAFSGQSGAAGQMPLIRYRLEREAKSAGALSKDSRSFLDGLRLPDSVTERVKVPTIDGRALYESLDRRDELASVLDSEWERMIDYWFKTYSGAEKSRDPVNRYFSRVYQATVLAKGISLKLLGPDVLIPGQEANFTLVISNNGSFPVRVGPQDAPWIEMGEVISLNPWLEISPNEVIPAGNSRKFEWKVPVPRDTQFTVPHSAHLYKRNYYGALATVTVKMKIGTAVDYVVGTSKILDVAPALEIEEVNPSPVVVNRPQVGASSAGVDILPPIPPKVTVKLINRLTRPFRGELAFGQENRSPETRRKIELAARETTSLTVTIPVKENNRAANGGSSQLADDIWFSLRNTGLHENLVKRRAPIVWADARLAKNLRVGYVRGFDFSLPNALNALGVESKELTVEEVKTADLSKYTSIIVDNRVYESQPELIAANQKLLDYAQAGGNLIVFYHRLDEFNPNPQRRRPQLAPYKLILGNERITDENAPITFIEPDHALLNSPNKLDQDDFKGWIQERGLYYPREWDPQFAALLQSNDPGEPPLKGGLLVADYGKGHYIYTSMVWYRQLRAGVPGAYRMLANMISYGRK